MLLVRYGFLKVVMHEMNNAATGCLTPRWRRPGIRRDLLLKLYDVNAGLAFDGANPGTSARGC